MKTKQDNSGTPILTKTVWKLYIRTQKQHTVNQIVDFRADQTHNNTYTITQFSIKLAIAIMNIMIQCCIW